MKKETILNILSSIIVIGAVIFELLNQIKETGELSLRSLLMLKPSPDISVAHTESGEDSGAELLIQL